MKKMFHSESYFLSFFLSFIAVYILQIAHKRLPKKLNQGHPWCLDIYHLKYCMSLLNLIKTFFEIYTIKRVIIRFIKNFLSLHQLFRWDQHLHLPYTQPHLTASLTFPQNCLNPDFDLLLIEKVGLLYRELSAYSFPMF